jgi:hypothetical protein
VVADTPRSKEYRLVESTLQQMHVVDLAPDDADVARLHEAYCAKYGIGGPFVRTGRQWRGIVYHSRVVAVFAEKWHSPKRLEISDAYTDGTRYGTIGILGFGMQYFNLVGSGVVDELVHTILAENAEHWGAVIRHTRDLPHALMFVHRRKEA